MSLQDTELHRIFFNKVRRIKKSPFEYVLVREIPIITSLYTFQLTLIFVSTWHTKTVIIKDRVIMHLIFLQHFECDTLFVSISIVEFIFSIKKKTTTTKQTNKKTKTKQNKTKQKQKQKQTNKKLATTTNKKIK